MRLLRRATRVLSICILVLSLLVPIGVGLFWVRSQGQNDSVQWHGQSTMLMSISSKGLVCLWIAADSLSKEKGWRYVDFGKSDYLRGHMSPGPNALGFNWYMNRTVGPPAGAWAIGGRPYLLVYFPYWLFLMVTSIPVLIWTFHRLWVRRGRLREGGCKRCGYNLTGNTSGICPECGETTSLGAGISSK